jgi:hypothetical protein
MVIILHYLEIEGNNESIEAKSPFFFEFILFLYISSLVPPVFGILNIIRKIATKI